MVGARAWAVGTYWSYKGATKGEPVIVTPPNEVFSKDVQAAAAVDMKALAGPCTRDTVVGDCSVLKRLLIDYGDLRQRIRAAREKG